MGVQVLLVDDDTGVLARLQPFMDPGLPYELGLSNLRLAKPVLQNSHWDMVVFNTQHGASAILAVLGTLTQLAQPPVVAFAGHANELSTLEAFCLRFALPYIGYLNNMDNHYRLQRMLQQVGRSSTMTVMA